MVSVKATREGLVGKTTATGWKIDKKMPFVALPSVEALYRFVRLFNPSNGRSCMAVVLDVGPWNTDDNAYVMLGYRPQAESGIDKSGRITNGAGIDLGEKVWEELGMLDNSEVEWEFIIA